MALQYVTLASVAGAGIKGGVAAGFLRAPNSHTWVYASLPDAWFAKA